MSRYACERCSMTALYYAGNGDIQATETTRPAHAAVAVSTSAPSSASSFAGVCVPDALAAAEPFAFFFFFFLDADEDPDVPGGRVRISTPVSVILQGIRSWHIATSPDLQDRLLELRGTPAVSGDGGPVVSPMLYSDQPYGAAQLSGSDAPRFAVPKLIMGSCHVSADLRTHIKGVRW